MIQTPDRIASHTDVSRHVGDGDATISPIAAANAISTDQTAAATMAPAITGPQWTYESGPPGVAMGPAAGSAVSTVTMCSSSAQAEERQDGQDHHDQADQINDAVH